MREQIERRLAELQQEQAKGEQMVRELDARLADVRATVLRIGGAVQVLHELLASTPKDDVDKVASGQAPATSSAP